ncbi:MAG: hypothetical protein E6H58_11075 [Betaproteobacteria bacterium]|nr:MAG: hypothetical protein E6H58_11075 [Betaproteobacteria bacterium]
MAESHMVTGLFRDRDAAERAYQSTADRGYGRNDVNVVMSDATRERYFAPGTTRTELGNKAAEGAASGGAGSGRGGTECIRCHTGAASRAALPTAIMG